VLERHSNKRRTVFKFLQFDRTYVLFDSPNVSISVGSSNHLAGEVILLDRSSNECKDSDVKMHDPAQIDIVRSSGNSSVFQDLLVLVRRDGEIGQVQVYNPRHCVLPVDLNPASSNVKQDCVNLFVH